MNERVSHLSTVQTAIDAVSDRLDQAVRAICVALILFMTIEVLAAVFSRYVFFAPFKWGEELARMTMVWTGLLGISIALRDGEHIGLETLLNRLNRRARAWFTIAIQLLVAVFLVVLLYWGARIALQAWNTLLPAMQIPWTWSMMAVPVTAAIQLVHLGRNIVDEMVVIRGGRP